MLALGLGAGGDGLPVGDDGERGVDFDTELPVDPGNGDVEMGVAETGEDCFTGVGAALDPDGRVLLLDPMQGRGELSPRRDGISE